MSTFQIYEYRESPDFGLYEFSATREGGKFEHAIDLHEQSSAIVVHVEGTGGDAEIELDGTNLSDPKMETMEQQAGPKKLLLKRIGNPVKRLVVKANATVGSTLKISILVVVRVADRVWTRIKCPVCKKLIRFLISAILTGLGVPDPDIAGSSWTRLRDFLDDIEDAPEIVKQILEQLESEFVREFLRALRRLLGIASRILEPIDSILTELCVYLKFCPDRHGQTSVR